MSPPPVPPEAGRVLRPVGGLVQRPDLCPRPRPRAVPRRLRLALPLRRALRRHRYDRNRRPARPRRLRLPRRPSRPRHPPPHLPAAQPRAQRRARVRVASPARVLRHRVRARRLGIRSRAVPRLLRRRGPTAVRMGVPTPAARRARRRDLVRDRPVACRAPPELRRPPGRVVPAAHRARATTPSPPVRAWAFVVRDPRAEPPHLGRVSAPVPAVPRVRGCPVPAVLASVSVPVAAAPPECRARTRR